MVPSILQQSFHLYLTILEECKWVPCYFWWLHSHGFWRILDYNQCMTKTIDWGLVYIKAFSPWVLRILEVSLVESVTCPNFRLDERSFGPLSITSPVDEKIYMESHMASMENIGWNSRDYFGTTLDAWRYLSPWIWVIGKGLCPPKNFMLSMDFSMVSSKKWLTMVI